MPDHDPHRERKASKNWFDLTLDRAIREFCLNSSRRSCPRLR
jgi:hypothetical protein